MEIIAHRGASDEAPENTIAAIQLAWEQNADALEIDIRLTKDRKIIVFHDDSLWRVGCGKEWKVAKKTLEELKTIDVGIWKEPIPEWAGHGIPTLEEALSTVPMGKRVYIEIKCEENILPELQEILGQYACFENVIITSFDLQVIKAVKKQLKTEVAWVQGKKFTPYLEEGEEAPKDVAGLVIDQAVEAGVSALSCRICLLKENFIERAKNTDLKLLGWTINEEKQFKFMPCLDGAITDRPGWLKTQFRKTTMKT
jgi:glycerophosphoryl diester phosphodiesterase